jgi:aspartate/methionine/tyrosine aminotransferase
MKLSNRTEWAFGLNALALAIDERKRRGESILDWTLSNPTLCGFSYPEEKILGTLASPAGLRYDPDPQGLREGRDAVSAWYARQGIVLDPASLFLTASSSEAYSWLFRLLCDSGDEVLIPKPGYPLFDDLARLSDVRLVTYRCRYDGLWHLDLETVKRGITSRTRAIVIIHPNNPTGNYLSAGERDTLCSLAADHDLALIADEVFWAFPFDKIPAPSLHGAHAPLIFVINGLSKLAGLPQLKLGWVALSGEPERVDVATKRLVMIGDTYLSVNTPVQAGLGSIIESSTALTEEICKRAASNHRAIGDRLRGTPITLLTAQGGWNAILRMPGHRTDDEWALHLLAKSCVLSYPGHFFDLEGGVFLVVSLIVQEQKTVDYLDRILTNL